MNQKLTRGMWAFLLAWLARLTFYVTGLNLRPSPERQAVPKDIATIVNTELRFGTDAVNFADVGAAT